MSLISSSSKRPITQMEWSIVKLQVRITKNSTIFNFALSFSPLPHSFGLSTPLYPYFSFDFSPPPNFFPLFIARALSFALSLASSLAFPSLSHSLFLSRSLFSSHALSHPFSVTRSFFNSLACYFSISLSTSSSFSFPLFK